MNLILASQSPYKAQQLKQLHLPFQTQSPNLDETARPNEQAKPLAIRLARQKAEKIWLAHPQDIVIGTDQTAALHTDILGKPNTQSAAEEQLKKCSGNTVTFHSALCLYHPAQSAPLEACVDTDVTFRHLTAPEIRRYIEIEKPLDCAGSFKCEGLGITLFDSICSQDPSALIGLPLITLNQFLLTLGLSALLD